MTSPATASQPSAVPEHVHLLERALDHIRHLVEEIGPRPSGSQNEYRASLYLADQLSGWGYSLTRQPAPFARPSLFFYPNIFAGFALCLASWLLNRFPWLALGMPFLFAALPEWARWTLRRCPRPYQTENLLAASQPSSEPELVLYLCAHLDTAPALSFPLPILTRLHSQRMYLIQRAAVGLAILALLRILGFELPLVISSAAGIIGSLAAIWWLYDQILTRPSRFIPCSPGAHDNASGVGVLLALAEYYAARPLQKVHLNFLFTGAEECGMHGAEAFASLLHPSSQPNAFLVLDMVGAGNALRYVSKDGIFFPLRTSPALNRLICAANPQARTLRYTLRSGDHTAFIRRGFPTAALQTSGSHKAELAYHSLEDTLAVIDPHALEITLDTVIGVIERLDSIGLAGLTKNS